MLDGKAIVGMQGHNEDRADASVMRLCTPLQSIATKLSCSYTCRACPLSLPGNAGMLLVAGACMGC